MLKPALGLSALGLSALGLSALGLASALLLVWGSSPAGAASVARQLVGVLASACLGAAAVLWVALDVRFARLPLHWVLGLALLLRVIAIQASPLLEDDHFRYLWDGLRTATSLDPYRLPPSAYFADAALPPMWQDVLSGINNPDLPTLYGPVLQGVFALAHGLAPASVFTLQSLLLVADMAVLGLLAHQGVGARPLLVYAVHPLVLKEALASAHPDGLVALLLLLAALAWQRRSAATVGGLLALAVCTKVAALVAVPLLLLAPPRALPATSPLALRFAARLAARRRAAAPMGTPMREALHWALRTCACFCAVCVALYAPLVWGGGSDAVGLAAFGTQWRFNPLLFRLADLALPAGAARPAAAVLIVAGIAVLAWRWHRSVRRAPCRLALPPLDGALAVLVLLSPVVNPWYWLWALPLSLRRGQGWLAVGMLAAPLAYLNTSVLAEASVTLLGVPDAPYAVLWPATVMQLLALELAWRWRRRLCLRP